MRWRISHVSSTGSTNADARDGKPGDVFTADFQTAGRGRLDHKWLSAPGENLIMSVVLDVSGAAPDQVATLPLVVGLAAVEGLAALLPPPPSLSLKWPNDVLAGGRKLAGILCERHGDMVIAGIGVNVRQTAFAPEISHRATSLALLGSAADPVCARDAVLASLDAHYARWCREGFASLHPRVCAVDCLKGCFVRVLQTDCDASPAEGVCGGIAADGSLLVAGRHVYAGEAHVAATSGAPKLQNSPVL